MDYIVVDQFYPKAQALRECFDRKFRNPLLSGPERFVWDFWHVPGQYTHLRTPAFHYFAKKDYEAFHRYLVRWGRENLGCHDISPPWLSCYIEGCRQSAHRDQPHGPLAYVFSLSQKGFRGGETFLQKSAKKISPKFNRLTLFNPSLLHGVKEVKGTMDPRRGRLVIHGWFVQPRPFWTGPLTVADVRRSIDNLDVPQGLGRGFLSMRLLITPSGTVSATRILVNTLSAARKGADMRFMKQVKALDFPKRPAYSRLTLPLIVS